MMEIRSLYIDLDKNVLEINGKPYEKPTIVNLPGPEGWDYRKVFNFPETVNSQEESDCLQKQSDCITVLFSKGD